MNKHLLTANHNLGKNGHDPNNNNNNSNPHRLATPCIGHEQSATSLFSIISEAKPAEIIVNECGEVELHMNKENNKYYTAYELIFQMNNTRENMSCMSSDYNSSHMFTDKLCCFAESKDGSLLLATDKGRVLIPALLVYHTINLFKIVNQVRLVLSMWQGPSRCGCQ